MHTHITTTSINTESISITCHECPCAPFSQAPITILVPPKSLYWKVPSTSPEILQEQFATAPSNIQTYMKNQNLLS